MACKSKNKNRARPSAHLKSVKTRDGKKVVVVNRDVRKKPVLRKRNIPIRSGKVQPKGRDLYWEAKLKKQQSAKKEALDVDSLLEGLSEDIDKRPLTKIHKDSFPGFEKEKRRERFDDVLRSEDETLQNIGFGDYMSVIQADREEHDKQKKRLAQSKFLNKVADTGAYPEFKTKDGVTFTDLDSEEYFSNPDSHTWSGVMSSGFEPLNKEKSKKIRSGKK